MSAAASPYRPAIVAGLIALLLAGRLVVAALVPLAPDEAYYALWARHLSPGYFDHPPMIAFFIRAGTALFGETPFGVRLVCVLSALPTSWLIWRSASLLLRDEAAGPIAALVFNVTLIGYFGMAVATPDAPLIVFAAAMLYVAARLAEAESPALWLAMGVVTGLAFLSKYSAALLAAAFSLAVLAIPSWRQKLSGPWPWLALAATILVFSPNILWNAANDWPTFAKQGGRVAQNVRFSPGYVLELVGAQIGLATPFILALGVVGLLPRAASLYRSAAARRVMLFFLLVPAAYFVFHALRARVEGNWPGFLYPALAVSAAAGYGLLRPEAGWRQWIARLAIPVGLAMALIGSSYVALGPLKVLGRKDPIVRTTRGWSDLAANVDALRQQQGASYILTYDYQLNAELALLLPDLPVTQYNERERYAMLGGPAPETMHGTGLLISRVDMLAALQAEFGAVEPLGLIQQRYGNIVIATFFVYRVERS